MQTNGSAKSLHPQTLSQAANPNSLPQPRAPDHCVVLGFFCWCLGLFCCQSLNICRTKSWVCLPDNLPVAQLYQPLLQAWLNVSVQKTVVLNSCTNTSGDVSQPQLLCKISGTEGASVFTMSNLILCFHKWWNNLFCHSLMRLWCQCSPDPHAPF